jgi:hypothetical protein
MGWWHIVASITHNNFNNRIKKTQFRKALCVEVKGMEI